MSRRRNPVRKHRARPEHANPYLFSWRIAWETIGKLADGFTVVELCFKLAELWK
jgi:hypothetical protein